MEILTMGEAQKKASEKMELRKPKPVVAAECVNDVA